MSLEPERDSGGLAALIVDALIDAGVIATPDFDRALAVATEEIVVRKALGDYWCSSCPLRHPRSGDLGPKHG